MSLRKLCKVLSYSGGGGAGAGGVFDTAYMRALRRALSVLGQWPHAALGSRTRLARMLPAYACFLILMGVCWVIGNISYLKKNIEIIPFIDLGHTYTNILITILYIQRQTLILQKKYCLVVKTFVLEFHLKYHENKSDYAVKEHHRINSICTHACVLVHFQLWFGTIMYNLVPLYNNFRSGMFSEDRPPNRTFEQALYYDVPFDQFTDTAGYFVMFIFNWYPAICVAYSICGFDLLILIMIFHISGHLNILKHNLSHFPRPSHSASQREYNEEVFILLRDIITHYNIIKKFMTDFSEAFDVMLCFYLAFHQVIGCMVLLLCSSLELEALLKYGMLTLFLYQQLIQTSVVFELIHTKSCTLGDAVYGLPWELMDTSNRRVVLLLLGSVQTPLAIKACGMVPVGVLTMSQIIKTSVSYYVMLRTFAD